MKVSKWGNSLAIRIPADVAEHLGFSEGDEILVAAEAGRMVAEKPVTKQEALKRLRALRGAIPADYKFKRADAYPHDKY